MVNPIEVTVNLMDESFNHHDNRNYGLAITLGDSAVTGCVLDFRRNKFLGLLRCTTPGSVLAEGTHESGLFRSFLGEVCNAFPWLRNTFKQVKIAYEGGKTTLVPAPLFDPEEKDTFLRFNFIPGRDELVSFDHLMPLDAYQVFSVPKEVTEAVDELFPGSRLVHASGFLIEGVWINYKNRISSATAFLHVREREFDLMIFDGRQMAFFNSFPYQNGDEVAYYLIFVLEQLSYNPGQVPVVLSGHFDMDPGLSELLYRYVRHVEKVKTNEAYRYSYVMNQLPMPAFFPLLNAFSCGL
jgi:hypothetical protein